jgi:hypothetical protein
MRPGRPAARLQGLGPLGKCASYYARDSGSESACRPARRGPHGPASGPGAAESDGPGQIHRQNSDRAAAVLLLDLESQLTLAANPSLPPGRVGPVRAIAVPSRRAESGQKMTGAFWPMPKNGQSLHSLPSESCPESRIVAPCEKTAEVGKGFAEFLFSRC